MTRTRAVLDDGDDDEGEKRRLIRCGGTSSPPAIFPPRRRKRRRGVATDPARTTPMTFLLLPAQCSCRRSCRQLAMTTTNMMISLIVKVVVLVVMMVAVPMLAIVRPRITRLQPGVHSFSVVGSGRTRRRPTSFGGCSQPAVGRCYPAAPPVLLRMTTLTTNTETMMNHDDDDDDYEMDEVDILGRPRRAKRRHSVSAGGRHRYDSDDDDYTSSPSSSSISSRRTNSTKSRNLQQQQQRPPRPQVKQKELPWSSQKSQPLQYLLRRTGAGGKEVAHKETTIIKKKENNNDNNRFDVRLLIIDHYDSFTYNLVDIVSQYCTQPPIVVAADVASTWNELIQNDVLVDGSNNIDGIILSPGPGNPITDEICSLGYDIIKQNPNIPILGVCLGHQIMGLAYGANVTKAPKPIHGQITPIYLNNLRVQNDPLFVNLTATASSSSSFKSSDNNRLSLSSSSVASTTINVTRYHSLHVTGVTSGLSTNNTTTTVEELIPSSYCYDDDTNSNNKDGCNVRTTITPVLMSMGHIHYPHYGLQFHPESIGTGNDGKKILHNFCHIVYDKKAKTIATKKATHYTGGRRISSSTASINGVDKATSAADADAATAPKHNRRKTISRGSCTVGGGNGNMSAMKGSVNKKDLYDYDNRTTPSRSLSSSVYEVYIHRVPKNKKKEDIAAAASAAATTTSSHDHNVGPTTRSKEVFLAPDQIMDEFLSSMDYSFWLDHSSAGGGGVASDSTVNGASSWTRSSNNNTPISILGYGSRVDHRAEYHGKEKPTHQRGMHYHHHEHGRLNNRDPNVDIFQYLERRHRYPTTHATMVTFVNEQHEEDENGDFNRIIEGCSNKRKRKRQPYNHGYQQINGYSSRTTQHEAVVIQTEMYDEDELQEMIPFQYRGGHVGFLGYEVRHDTIQYLRQQEMGNNGGNVTGDDNVFDNRVDGVSDPKVPTAAFIFADRSFVYDHNNDEWYLVGVVTKKKHNDDHDNDDAEREEETVLEWMRSISERMQHMMMVKARKEEGKRKNTDLLHDDLKMSSSYFGRHTNGLDSNNGSSNMQKKTMMRNGRSLSSSLSTPRSRWGWSVKTRRKRTTEETTSRRRNHRHLPSFQPVRSRQQYMENFNECIRNIINGESYELCLTNQFQTTVRRSTVTKKTMTRINSKTSDNDLDRHHDVNKKKNSNDALDLYHILRRRNPAPYSAFFNWNGNQDVDRQRSQRHRHRHNSLNGSTDGLSSSLSSSSSSAFSICCSSPERFISVKPMNKIEKQQPSSITTTPASFRGGGGGGGGGYQQQPQQASTNKQKLFQVEAKPIKGTCARVIPSSVVNEDGTYHYTAEEMKDDMDRAKKLQSSTKDRAENLMIVDLLRNDLSRVCQSGSIHVSKLMDIESYKTVHQMVSTIRGTLCSSTKDDDHGKNDFGRHKNNGNINNDARSAIDVLKACFPGGSMTGAPKIRTMELLHDIEGKVCRGPYSGCLGYVSINGSMDMNIVIRTAIVTPKAKKKSTSVVATETINDNTDYDVDREHGRMCKVTIGAGGAITALSKRVDEYDEMLLKASAIMDAVREWASTSTLSSSSSEELLDEEERLGSVPERGVAAEGRRNNAEEEQQEDEDDHEPIRTPSNGGDYNAGEFRVVMKTPLESAVATTATKVAELSSSTNMTATTLASTTTTTTTTTTTSTVHKVRHAPQRGEPPSSPNSLLVP